MSTEVMTFAPSGTALLALDSPEFAGLAPSKAEQIRATFVPMADMLEAFEGDYNEVMALAAQEVTAEVSARARRLRLDIAKVRIAAEKARVAIKAEFVLAGKAIDGANNVLKHAISGKEEALESIEKHAERMEAERRAAIQAERAEALEPYVTDAAERDLAGMDDEVWTAFFAMKKKDHEDRLEAERQAEAARIAEAEANARYVARTARVAPFFDFIPEQDIGALSDKEFEALLVEASEAKAAHAAEQERVRAEATRLAAEARAAEEARQAELAAIEAERQKERQAAEAERDRLAELEAAEKARLAAEAEKEKARAIAAEKAAKAPVKKRLVAWVDTFALPELPGDEHEKAAEIRARFEAFQAWARKEVDSI